MHFHARAIENWGCPAELYPQALELVLNGRVKVTEFIEKHRSMKSTRCLPQPMPTRSSGAPC